MDVATDPSSWLDEMSKAKDRLSRHLRPTPLVRSDYLSRKLGRPVLLKLESMQPVGAFKVRPALNSILAHLHQCRSAGVVTNSSGNFAQAVAYAATLLGVESSIVMMRGASAFKRDRTRRFGGNVVLCEDTYSARSETTERIRRESGRYLVHPFDSTETIAGNCTLGMEIAEQVDGDFAMYVPISGGGLIAGAALGAKAVHPACQVLGVQAEANPATKRSLEQGRRVRSVPSPSLADALTVPTPGARTFPIIQRQVEDVLLASERQMAASIRLLALEQKLVVEAGGAVSVAGALARPPEGSSPVVCVISGGNIAPSQLRSILTDAD